MHYYRWGQSHLPDMLDLEISHPDQYEQFMKENFVFRESGRNFSGLGLDQAHEYNDQFIKAD